MEGKRFFEFLVLRIWIGGAKSGSGGKKTSAPWKNARTLCVWRRINFFVPSRSTEHRKRCR